MLCYVHETKECHTRTEQRAANGTTCGDRMVSAAHRYCKYLLYVCIQVFCKSFTSFIISVFCLSINSFWCST